MSETHTILGGKVRIYKRETGSNWFCATFIEGKNRRVSTKEESLSRAKEFAEDWYFGLRDKQRSGDLIDGITFEQAANKFMEEYEALTAGERHPMYVQGHRNRANRHLIPFFGDKPVRMVSSGLMQEYRIKRMQPDDKGKVPARSTLHHEEVTLRQIMKTALRHGWIDALPDFSAPYKASSKVSHRGWFDPEEYKKLYLATRKNAEKQEGTRNALSAAQLHDKVLFMANTGLRPDEANILEYRDVKIEKDRDSGETILLIEVRGKRGVGYCKSTKGAVFPFQRLLKRNNPQPTDLVFPHDHKKAFNRILNELNLKVDREGNARTFYSLRHTYICLRLLEGADIYQVSKNCRTSVEMIEKHYAVHLKNTLDASAINVKRSSSNKRQ